MKKFSTEILFTFLALVAFIAIALAYNMPVVNENKAIAQPDIVNYRGSAEEMYEFERSTGETTYWSDAMFGGMPTYQTGAKYENNLAQKIDEFLRFLPRPADYIFLLFAGFFVLGCVLFRDWRYAFLGALLFGLGTYFFIVIEAGHNAKVHAVAYFAPLTAGIILLYQKKYKLGFLLTALFMALELVANHPQMTYYLGLALIIYVIIQAVESVKNGELKSFALSSSLAVVAVALGIGMNSTGLMATYEYGKSSTRGKNDVSLLQNQNQEGLNSDYITAWSYGKLETLNLLIPNLMGGGSSTGEEVKGNLKKSIEQSAQSQEEYNYYMQSLDYIPTYWGTQPFTSGPAYQGAIVVLLFLLGIFLVKGKYKWWLLLATLLSILLAWGKNLMWFTDLFIDYIPLYDKFRAVSSALVIAEFTMPLLAVWAVYSFINNRNLGFRQKRNILMGVGGGLTGLLLLFYLFGGSLFDFKSAVDNQLPQFMKQGIRQDRIEMFTQDTGRSLIFILLVLGLMFAYLYEKIKNKTILILGLAALTLIDLWGVDKRYLNDENFIKKQWVSHPFPTEMNDRLYNEAQQNSSVMQVAYRVNYNHALSNLKKQDPGHYRVYNAAGSAFNEAGTSFFVNSLGGYHGAKLQSIQNVIDVYFSQDSVLEKRLGTYRKLPQILNLFNVKYIVSGNPQEPKIIENPETNGNAWFVKQMIQAKNANQALVDMGKIDSKNEAVIYTKPKYAVNNENAEIQLTNYQPNKLEYESDNPNDGFAVFSEVYYKEGWTASIDGELTEILPTNYMLRGLYVPKGKHKIVFTFAPEVVKRGTTIAFGANVLFVIALLAIAFMTWRNGIKPNIEHDR